MQTGNGAIRVQGFSYRGLSVPAIGLYGGMDMVEDMGEGTAYDLSSRSCPLSWKVAFYMVGRGLALGIKDADRLPKNVKEFGRRVYARAQEKRNEGTWHMGAVLIEPENTPIKCLQKPGEGYAAALYFPKGFSNGTCRITEEGCEGMLWLPPGDRFIVPTPFGTYYSNGIPMATAEKADALKIWVDSGLSEEQAMKEMSEFVRESSGPALVSSSSGSQHGPLGIRLHGIPPKDHLEILGSFPLAAIDASEFSKDYCGY